ncbi:putative WRKY transcription factor 34 [Zea mays]|uniref:Putative WRKY transcription factor 34 n=1 Tax=Zea mays TaxID=4577 RepID=A0A1D6ES14_MAIZE|nr:putative WRKY transcription factor 34 [Zea mays]
MSGASNYGSLIDEWLLPPTPSPRTLMSSFLNEEFSSAPFSGPHDQSEKSREVLNSSDEVPSHAVKGPFQNGFPNLFSAKSNSNGGLAERRAARAGFSVPKIDTSRVGSSTVIRSPVSIPPGLSPTTLLESPVFLYNKMAQPSPTTGTLPFLMATNDKSTISPAAKITEDSTFDNDVFSFQPHLGSEQTGFSTAEKHLLIDSCARKMFFIYRTMVPMRESSPCRIFISRNPVSSQALPQSRITLVQQLLKRSHLLVPCSVIVTIQLINSKLTRQT